MNGSIRGLQRAQAATNQAAAAVKPRGALGRAVKYVTARLHRYAVTINPVDTGSWRAGQRQQLSNDGRIGQIFIQPGAQNSRTSTPVIVYANVWENRGGRYAIYKRTVQEEGREALDVGGKIVRGALP